MRLSIPPWAAVGLASLLLASSIFAGDFEDGMQFVLSKDYARAVQSFRKAAEDGNADAQFNLGVMYSKGRGVEQDYARAAHWYRKAHNLLQHPCGTRPLPRNRPALFPVLLHRPHRA